jgi:hypothetical protein
MQRRDVDGAGDPARQPFRRARDLRLPRQEDQRRAGLGAQRLQSDRRHLILKPRAGVALDIAGLDRKGAALALDHGRPVQQTGHTRAVDRRGHDDEAEIVAQRHGVDGEREPEIAIEAALVELVEQHSRHAGQGRIVQDHAGEHALGHDLDPGAR